LILIEGEGFSMIVFTRKRGEKVIVANAIEITVLQISKTEVRLGIDAPEHITVYRAEVYDRLKREDPSAVKSQLLDEQTLKRILEEPGPKDRSGRRSKR
jgi:carbon storage regulator